MKTYTLKQLKVMKKEKLQDIAHQLGQFWHEKDSKNDLIDSILNPIDRLELNKSRGYAFNPVPKKGETL